MVWEPGVIDKSFPDRGDVDQEADQQVDQEADQDPDEHLDHDVDPRERSRVRCL